MAGGAELLVEQRAIPVATWRAWSATARRLISRVPSGAATASRRRAFANSALGHAQSIAERVPRNPARAVPGGSMLLVPRTAGLGAGQAQPHQRPAAGSRLGGDGAAVLAGDLADDRQAKARAGSPARLGAAVEAVEDMGEVLL